MRDRPAPVTVRVPAKVNLHLGVGELRPDGYHDLTTVFHAVSLYDEVSLLPAAELTVELNGGAAGVPADASNLAARAAVALAERTGREPGVHIRIRKGIPVAGGMAGGSADAAAALLGCDALWGCGLAREELVALAAELGSDVPFALQGGTAYGTGRGELLSPVLVRGRFHWVLAQSEEGLSTPQVYAALDRLREQPGAPPPAGEPRAVLAALGAGDARALGSALANDLQPAAVRLRPRLSRVLEAGADLGSLGAVVSGSGPTVALLARDEPHAVSLSAALAGLDVCRAARPAYGPVPGATLVP